LAVHAAVQEWAAEERRGVSQLLSLIVQDAVAARAVRRQAAE
jgi:hypothetical protein